MKDLIIERGCFIMTIITMISSTLIVTFNAHFLICFIVGLMLGTLASTIDKARL